MNAALAAELAAMVQVDQALRQPSATTPRRFSTRLSVDRQMEWQRVSVSNTDRLRAIITTHGWPGFALVGEAGADHAWLLAQHSDTQLDFQREALDLLIEAVAKGDARASHVAYLTDRVHMNEGGHQVYGTQMAGTERGRVLPWPIAEPAEVDARRASVGLEPLADYIASFGPVSDTAETDSSDG